MGNPYFKFKQFTIQQDACAMKVSTDACLFGAWAAEKDSQNATQNILDIGTGTGLLSLMLAQKSDAVIHAIDIEAAAVSQARSNFNTSPWAQRLTVEHVAVQNLGIGKSYDLVICNPPFYENSLATSNKEANLARHDSGLLLHELFKLLPSLMTTAGKAAILLPYSRATEARKLANEHGVFLEEECIVSDTQDSQPIRIMLWLGREEVKTSSYKMHLKETDRNYSDAFTKLLAPYYLYL